MSGLFAQTLWAPGSYSPDGDPEYGPDCPACGCEMEEMERHGRHRRWQCPRCEQGIDPYGETADHGQEAALSAWVDDHVTLAVLTGGLP